MERQLHVLVIQTGGRLTSWLLTQCGRGVELRTTESKINPDSIRVEDLNQGPPDFKSGHVLPYTTRPHCLPQMTPIT